MSDSGVSAARLAEEWGVSKNRVYQLIKEGRIRYLNGQNGPIDFAHAKLFRRSQVARDPKRTLFTEHSNDGRTKSLAKSKLLATRKDDDDLLAMPGEDEDGLLDLSDPAEQSAETGGGLKRAIQQNDEANEIKLKILAENLRAKEFRRLRDEGRYVLREEDHRHGVEAGKIISSMLRALPDQIAGAFAEPASRNAVRRTVFDIVDRMQHAVFAQLTKIDGGSIDDI